MNQNDYKRKLENALRVLVQELIISRHSISIKNHHLAIANVENVSLTTNIDVVEAPILFSGQELALIVNGEVSLFEVTDDGSRKRYVTFSINPAKIKFDATTLNFEIVDITNFLPSNFR